MKAKAKHTYWCGWEEPAGIPDEDKLARWPAGMKGWWSGSGDRVTIWVGRVDAADADAAEEIVRSCYGRHGKKIKMRWDPEENDLGWRPTGGRFPE